MDLQTFNALKLKYNIQNTAYLSSFITVDGYDLSEILLAKKCVVTSNVASGVNAGNTANNDFITDILGYRVSVLCVFTALSRDVMKWVEWDVLKRRIKPSYDVKFDDMGVTRTAKMYASPNSSWTTETVNGMRTDGQVTFIDLKNQRVNW
jgi:hypothetical protein